MSANIYHPSRGGVRGGRDQFNWDDVKDDKDRENYLGHSVKAPVGRWQKGKDLIWYTRDKSDGDSVEERKRKELQSVKDLEAQAMATALGYKVSAKPLAQGNVEDKDRSKNDDQRGETRDKKKKKKRKKEKGKKKKSKRKYQSSDSEESDDYDDKTKVIRSYKEDRNDRQDSKYARRKRNRSEEDDMDRRRSETGEGRREHKYKRSDARLREDERKRGYR